MIWRLVKDLDLLKFWPYGRLKGPKIENERLKNNVLSTLRPTDKNPRRHEQVYKSYFFLNCRKWLGMTEHFAPIKNEVISCKHLEPEKLFVPLGQMEY